MSIKGLDYSRSMIGIKIPSSKYRYFWKLDVDGVEHSIEFLDSRLSGKKRLFIDGVKTFKKTKFF